MQVPSGPRTLILLDIENQNEGDASRVATTDSVSHLERFLGPNTLVWAACSHAFVECMLDNQGWSWKLTRGKDGADLNLLERFEHEGLPSGVDHVVIASGDHAFADVAARIAANGVRTTVVARAGTLSNRLRLAAMSTLILPSLSDSINRNEAA